jgi:hypothetical protein
MAKEDVHIINRQVFEFDCKQSEHAFQIQRKVDHVVQERISRAINRVCNQLTSHDEDIRLPLLEIDLGNISFETLEEDIAAVFEKRFYEKLSEKINTNVALSAGRLEKQQSAFEPLEEDKAADFEKRPYEKLLEKINTNTARSPGRFEKQQSTFESLRYFLLTGQLPWFAGKRDGNYIPGVLDEIFTMQPGAFRRLLILNLRNEKFVERLIATIDISRIIPLLEMLDIPDNLFDDAEAEVRKVIVEIFTDLQEIQKIYAASTDTGPFTSQELLQFAAAEKEIAVWLNADEAHRMILSQKMTLEGMLKIISGNTKYTDAPQFYKLLQQLIATKFSLDYKTLDKVVKQQPPVHSTIEESISQIQQKIEKEVNLLAESANDEEPDENIPRFYISNSGLILIAQYLPAFFNVLGLLEQGSFSNTQQRIKAVFLLHYMCTGEEKVPEHILPLNKLLCGLPMDETLPSFVSLSEEEKIECMELLQEVIYNWERLGQSSADSFREAFLNRDGILWYDDVHGWKLQVERRGYDVLLDSLPWSYKQIKLSWMEHIINTEW